MSPSRAYEPRLRRHTETRSPKWRDSDLKEEITFLLLSRRMRCLDTPRSLSCGTKDFTPSVWSGSVSVALCLKCASNFIGTYCVTLSVRKKSRGLLTVPLSESAHDLIKTYGLGNDEKTCSFRPEPEFFTSTVVGRSLIPLWKQTKSNRNRRHTEQRRRDTVYLVQR